jgi:hypothetical protein
VDLGVSASGFRFGIDEGLDLLELPQEDARGETSVRPTEGHGFGETKTL